MPRQAGPARSRGARTLFPAAVTRALAATLVSLVAGCSGDSAPHYVPRTRTYFIAAEEVDWDFAPDGRDVVMDQPFNDEQKVFVAGDGKTRVGSLYKKALYREYTDATFATPRERPAEDGYLGMVGPVIHGVVGDEIHVVFKNNGTHPYSIHPHGVFYGKNAEGAMTADGTSGADMADDAVAPGATFTYVWKVPERAGPGPGDPSSIAWVYHSHVDAIGDEYAGLIGVIVIASAEVGTDSGRASDVDREVVSLFMVDDENKSTLAEENFQRFAPDAGPEDDGFIESNLMHSINGRVYGNGPRLRITEGTRVRWYLATLGTEVDLHTPHWHGNTVLVGGHREDVADLMPAMTVTADMVPDDVGVWMFHCHVNDHIAAGMMTLYEVLAAPK